MTKISSWLVIRQPRTCNIWMFFLLCLALLNITGCGVPSAKLSKKSSNNLVDNARELARKKPNDDNFTVNPATLNTDAIADKNSSSESGKALFSTTLATADQRITRLEENVQKISDTLARMAPSITRLMDVERDLGHLTFQLEEIINNKKNTTAEPSFNNYQVSSPSKMVKPLPHNEKSTLKNPISSDAVLHNLRLGDHPDKLRLVFESTEKLDYEIGIDNVENIMIITFPKGHLNRDLNKLSHTTKAIKSIHQNIDDTGNAIIFELSAGAQKIKDFRISPNNKNKYHRIVIDVVGFNDL